MNHTPPRRSLFAALIECFLPPRRIQPPLSLKDASAVIAPLDAALASPASSSVDAVASAALPSSDAQLSEAVRLVCGWGASEPHGARTPLLPRSPGPPGAPLPPHH